MNTVVDRANVVKHGQGDVQANSTEKVKECLCNNAKDGKCFVNNDKVKGIVIGR